MLNGIKVLENDKLFDISIIHNFYILFGRMNKPTKLTFFQNCFIYFKILLHIVISYFLRLHLYL